MSHYADIDRREFVKTLERVSQRYHIMDVFSDFCAAASCAVEQMTNCVKEREERYKSVLEKYTQEERNEFPKLLGLLVDALSEKRESFLGPVLEEIGAANVRNGQFLTPASVANMMASVSMGEYVHTPGNLVTINDPACGGGVTLIAQGEMLMREKHVPQRDIFITGGDIDCRACDMTFTELTLLGYAARIDHMDALTMKVLSRPRWTVGYYLHGTQWREGRKFNNSNEETTEESQCGETESTTRQSESHGSQSGNGETIASSSVTDNECSRRRLTQAVFSL